MLGAALDKKLCWEPRLIINYAWSCVRQKAMLGAVLDKKLCWELRYIKSYAGSCVT